MKTKSAFLESIIEHKQILIAVTAVLTLLGVVALVEMPRDEFPQFAIRQGLIIGVYPGASSRQVEEQLTKKVEQYLFRYEAVDRAKTYSISKENVMVIYVEIDEREKDPEAFWAKFRLGLNELKGQLPACVTSLVADNEFGNASALLLGVQSETKTYRELNEYVESFEDEVRKIPEVSRIKHFGQQNEVINVYIDNGKLARYGITPLAILSALKMEGSVNYAGEIDNGTRINPIHIPLRYKTESDVANQIVYHDPSGSVVRVKDIARVRREYKESDSYVRVDGKKCLIVSLEMRPGKNVVQFGKDVQRTIDKFSASLPSDVKIITISNMPDAVSRAIHNFMREFAISIVCVILVTVVLLPRRVALVAAATIPISILITLGFMWISGMDLQTVSLAGLIVVLGMVVDNAIIIIDHYVEKLDTGTAPRDAASQSVMDLFGSVFYATVIIIFCFVPMSMMQHGMVRDFVRSLPWTIGYALCLPRGNGAVASFDELHVHQTRNPLSEGERKEGCVSDRLAASI
jgi:multidrug efflux pump subunit AcrB